MLRLSAISPSFSRRCTFESTRQLGWTNLDQGLWKRHTMRRLASFSQQQPLIVSRILQAVAVSKLYSPIQCFDRTV